MDIMGSSNLQPPTSRAAPRLKLQKRGESQAGFGLGAWDLGFSGCWMLEVGALFQGYGLVGGAFEKGTVCHSKINLPHMAGWPDWSRGPDPKGLTDSKRATRASFRAYWSASFKPLPESSAPGEIVQPSASTIILKRCCW